MRSSATRPLVVAAAVLLAACNSSTDTASPATTVPGATSSDPPATAVPDATSPDPPATTAVPSTTSALTDSARTALPPQPAGVEFPTVAWPEGVIPAGVDADAVAAVIEDAFGNSGAPYGQIDAVLVVRGGEIVFERYDDSYPAEQPHDSWSVAKSVTHGMLGVLVRDGQLDMDAPAAIAEWSEPGDERAAITPRLLARMSSGLEWTEGQDAVRLVGSAGSIDAAARQIDRPLAADVGSVFNYSTGSTAVNGRLIGDLVGTGDDFRTWADAELFGPLGIESVELVRDGNGYWVAGYGADMTARDFARFGLLYLRDGVWDGARILPEGWVDTARTPSATDESYGEGFWIGLNGEDTFSAEGFLGQKVVIVPDSDMVVVVLSDNFAGAPTAAFASEIVELFRAS